MVNQQSFGAPHSEPNDHEDNAHPTTLANHLGSDFGGVPIGNTRQGLQSCSRALVGTERRTAMTTTQRFKAIAVADTSIASDNLGDQVIMMALERELRPVLADRATLVVPTHSPLGYRGRRILDAVDICLVGGTNLLPARPGPRQLWRLPPQPSRRRKFVLVGCGFDRTPTRSAAAYLRSVLHPNAVHSCRDAITQQYLLGMGMRAELTGCVTTWSTSNDAITSAERRQLSSSAVLITNSSLRSSAAEENILNAASETYDSVSVWLQAPRDLTQLDHPRLRAAPVVSGGPSSLVDHLRRTGADVVTTRLHAALLSQRTGARSTLFALDDRVARTCDAVGASYHPEPASVAAAAEAIRTSPRTFRPRTSEIDRWRDALIADLRSE